MLAARLADVRELARPEALTAPRADGPGTDEPGTDEPRTDESAIPQVPAQRREGRAPSAGQRTAGDHEPTRRPRHRRPDDDRH